MYYDKNTGQAGLLQNDGTVSPLALQSTVTQDTTFINTGHFGNYGQGYATHLHEETFMAPDGRQLSGSEFFTTDAIDQRVLLSDPDKGLQLNVQATAVQARTNADGKVSYVTNGGTYDARWDSTLNSWVNDAQHLILNRAQQTDGMSGNDSYWVTWHEDPAQREKVIWIESLPDGRRIDAWLNMDLTKKWNSQTRTWETL